MATKLPEFQSLKEIAEFDFQNYAHELLGLEYLNEDLRNDEDVKELQNNAAFGEKHNAVSRYLLSEKGDKQFRESWLALMKKFDVLRIEFLTIEVIGRIKSQAADELINKSELGQFAAFELILKGDLGIASQRSEGIKLFEEVASEILAITGQKDCNGLVDKIYDQPDWIDIQMGKLEKTHELFRQCVPGGKFLPKGQAEAAAELIFGSGWTPQCSVKYFLESSLKTPVTE